MPDFLPTPEQERFLQATLDLGFNVPVAERARFVDADERAAQGWMKDERFKLWLAAEYERFMKEEVMRVWASLFDKAVKKQDTKAAELFLERFDPDFSSRRRAEKPHRRAAKITMERLLQLAREGEGEKGNGGE